MTEGHAKKLIAEGVDAMQYCKAENMSDERGPYLRITTTSPGPCGSCPAVTYTFINRGGKTCCVACDAEEDTHGVIASYRQESA